MTKTPGDCSGIKAGRRAGSGRQNGMILLVTLVVMLLVSLLVGSSVRTASFEEAMAMNAQVQNQTFQAAESALNNVIANPGVIEDTILSVSGFSSAALTSLALGGETQLQRLRAGSEVSYLGDSICIGFSLDKCRRHNVELTGQGFIDQDTIFGNADDEGRTALHQGYERYNYVIEE